MILDKAQQSFRGVVCLHCKAPIPVPSVVEDVRPASVQEIGASQGRSAVFNLRCSVCHKEKPYRTREIVDFAGVPEPIAPFAQPATMRSMQMGENTRAAKA